MSQKGLTSLLFTAALGLSPAQSPETIARPLTEKQRVKKEAALKKELESTWSRWVHQDVAWIITDEERTTFKHLGTDDEREQFVEQFWLRRVPTPDTVENEYKEEHYRRIAYANEHFASGIPGWKTDRGRMYIRFGAPDEIEAHPSGGTYERPPEQGGGTTSTYPFEQWRYRHLDNVGENIVLEFVDTTMSGEYHLAFDPCENDALKNVPGAGPTLAEQIGLSTKAARFQNTNGTTCGAPLGGTSASSNQFDRLAILANVEKAPPVKFKDLEETVNSTISFNTLPMLVHIDYLRVTDATVLANVTVQFENRNLGFQLRDGLQRSEVNVFGRVYTMTRRPVATFEKPLAMATPSELLAQYAQQKSVYQESLPLAPGRYKLDLVAKDTVSGNMNRYEVVLDVPRYDQDTLATSSLILADSIQKLPMKKTGGEMFAIGDWKVRPRVNSQFSRDEKLGFYLQVYNLMEKEFTRKPQGEIGYQIVKAGTSQPVLEFTEELGNVPEASAHQVTIGKMVPLKELDPGEYTLLLKVSDGDRTLQRQAQFTVK
jgi:GWxTD domain-containing protein